MPCPAPSPRAGLGGHWEPGVKMGGEPEARLGWIINTLERNSSSWFPPSVSEGYKMGPCEQEGGV